MSLVTEDSVTISWIKPLAPFDYYKMSYQSARGGDARSAHQRRPKTIAVH